MANANGAPANLGHANLRPGHKPCQLDRPPNLRHGAFAKWNRGRRRSRKKQLVMPKRVHPTSMAARKLGASEWLPGDERGGSDERSPMG